MVKMFFDKGRLHNSKNIKKWKISLQWLFGQFPRDDILPTLNRTLENFENSKNFNIPIFWVIDFSKFSDVQSHYAWVKCHLR